MGNNSDKVYYDAKGRAHRRGPLNSSERHHHHRRHRSTTQKVLLVLLYVLIALAAIVLVTWRVLDARGKSALYRQAVEEVPLLSEVETEEQAGAEQEALEKAEEWKAGWVRYNGSVYEYNSDILTFLIMGIDQKNGVVQEAKDGISGGQADGLYLVVVNPDLKKYSIIAINRNTITDIDVYDVDGNYVGTGKAQICLQHGYGDGLEQSCERQEKVVRNLFYNIPIHGYASINLGAVEPLTDAVGGVTVPKMTFENGEVIYGDMQTLNGKEAYRYVQRRDINVFDSASFRLEKQKEFLKAFMAKLKEKLKSNPAKAVEIFNAVTPYMVTDIGLSEVTYLAGQMGNYQFDSNIYSLKGTTTPAEEAQTEHEEFIYDENALYDLMIQLFYKRVR